MNTLSGSPAPPVAMPRSGRIVPVRSAVITPYEFANQRFRGGIAEQQCPVEAAILRGRTRIDIPGPMPEAPPRAAARRAPALRRAALEPLRPQLRRQHPPPLAAATGPRRL